MIFQKKLIKCQDPENQLNILRDFGAIKITVKKDSESYKDIFKKAKSLSLEVSSASAKESALSRNEKRLITDSFGGLLAEKGWLEYINSRFDDIATETQFQSASNQIDIKLTNGELIEVRSSFIRNGVKFGICNKLYNFKNIGPYSNSIKIGEIQKDLYCGVLFETSKGNLLDDDEVIFWLVGSSTWDMMINLGIDTELNADDVIALSPGKYKVVYYKDSMDLMQFNEYLVSKGYSIKK